MSVIITIVGGAEEIIVNAGVEGKQGATGLGSTWGGIAGTLSDQTDLQVELDFIEPTPRTITSSYLLTDNDRVVYVDPTTGPITVTLPPVVDGVPLTIVRVVNGFNPVIISGEDVNGGDSSLILGLPSQKLCLLGDEARNTYRLISPPPAAFGTIARTTQNSHIVSGTYSLYNDWESIVFSTPGRLIPNLTTNEIDYIHNEVNPANPQTGFNISLSMVFEASNNKNCKARIMYNPTNGSPYQLAETATTGQGPSRSAAIHIDDQVGLFDTGAFYVELEASAGDTWTIFNAKLNVSRITG